VEMGGGGGRRGVSETDRPSRCLTKGRGSLRVRVLVTLFLEREAERFPKYLWLKASMYRKLVTCFKKKKSDPPPQKKTYPLQHKERS